MCFKHPFQDLLQFFFRHRLIYKCIWLHFNHFLAVLVMTGYKIRITLLSLSLRIRAVSIPLIPSISTSKKRCPYFPWCLFPLIILPHSGSKKFHILDSLAMMDCMICVCFCNSDKTSSHIATLNIENSPFSFACYNTMPVCNCSAQYSFLLSRLSAKTLATSATILIF